jgi:ASC-1-like (ASCH) protein
MGQTEGVRTKTLWVRPEYLEWILAGRKTIEVRVGYPNIARLRPGDQLLLNGVHAYRIVRIADYPDFDALLLTEDSNAIAPDCPPERLLEDLRSIYSREKEALGVYALHICFEDNASAGCRLDDLL